MGERSPSYPFVEASGTPEVPTNRTDQEIHLCYIDAWMSGVFAELDIAVKQAHAPLVNSFDRRQFSGFDREPRRE